MIRKQYLSSIVYTEQLRQQGLEWKTMDYPHEVLVSVQSRTPHAVVRDSKTNEDIGIILYSQRNGLPYSEFEESVQYLFIKMGKVLSCARPMPIN